ncbi:unnamed protein product [Mytilus coruscus]|uniref:Reverse transcriptase zinc-binding domain-containing protein n=1 Tax=Mytilus coruscus TaxID=42192 RepID=A0A6J8DND6_MYTCO|nr:unnamed protein product [Mytilus coruscus]
MKTGKASDQFGNSAEQFKYGGDKTAVILTCLLNEAFKFKCFPHCGLRKALPRHSSRDMENPYTYQNRIEELQFFHHGKVDGVSASQTRRTQITGDTITDKILRQYNLPCASGVLLNLESKYKWKKKVKKSVDSFWFSKMSTEAKSKSSLRFLNVENCKVGVISSIQKNAGTEHMCIRKAYFKAKMLLDTYILQYHRSKFSNGQNLSDCPLCGKGIEDLEQFLVVCSALSNITATFSSHEPERYTTQKKPPLDNPTYGFCFDDVVILYGIKPYG